MIYIKVHNPGESQDDCRYRYTLAVSTESPQEILEVYEALLQIQDKQITERMRILKASGR